MSLEAWKSVFEFGGVLLLALTFVFGAGAYVINNRLNAEQAKQLRAFDKDLTDAKIALGKQQEIASQAAGKLAGLEQAAADAKAEMAKQQTRAATAETKLLELQQTLADRTLTKESAGSLVRNLKEFSGQKFQVLAYSGNPESENFAKQLIEILSASTWQYFRDRNHRMLIGVVVGVQVSVLPQANDQAKNAATALVKTLNAANFRAELIVQEVGGLDDLNTLDVAVGTKR